MKKIFIVGLLCIVYTFSSQAQGLYSKQNLQKASQENLGIYLAKAKKLKKTGKTMSIIGSLAFVGGAVVFNDSWGNADATTTDFGGIITFAGFLITVVGVPLLITGASRVKRITGVMNTDSNSAFIEIAPCRFSDFKAQNNQAGITLRLRF